MLTGLKLRNFKAIGDEPVELELAPLTLLVGANGSGKSSVLEAVGVLAETADAPSAYGLVIRGSRVFFPRIDMVFHRRDGHRTMTIGIVVRNDPHASARTTSYELRTRFQSSLWNLTCAQSIEVTDGGARPEQLARTEWREGEPPFSGIGTFLAFPSVNWTGTPFLQDLVLHPRSFEPRPYPDNPAVRDAVTKAERAVGAVREFLTDRVSFLDAARGSDMFRRPDTATGGPADSVPAWAIHLAHVAASGPGSTEAWRSIGRWSDAFGMPHLAKDTSDEANITVPIRFHDPHAGTALPLSSATGGSLRLLPFLVHAFAFPSPRTLLVDEIDASLHPDWQLLIAELLAEIVKDGKQVVATTHSPTMVLAVCAAVAKGLMKPEDVALYGFERGSNGATAMRLTITKSGWIKGGWIESFAKVERQLLRSFLRGKESDDEETDAIGATEGGHGRGGHGRVSESPRDPPGPATSRTQASKRRRKARR